METPSLILGLHFSLRIGMDGEELQENVEVGDCANLDPVLSAV